MILFRFLYLPHITTLNRTETWSDKDKLNQCQSFDLELSLFADILNFLKICLLQCETDKSLSTLYIQIKSALFHKEHSRDY